MANYGIKFCQKVLNDLEEKEDKLFEKQGYGFIYMGQDHLTQLGYKELLREFKAERAAGMPPSYTPSIHGSFDHE